MGLDLRYLDATRPEIAGNLALDEALLVDAEERGGPPVLRVWESDRFAVVLGASCRLLDDVRVDACRADGVAIARRSSGGGTVVIGPGALNFTVVLPIESSPELKAVDTAQAFVLGRTAGAIARAGVPVAVRGSGDLVLGDRKCSGSAQRRLRRHLLIHASLLYDFPLERIDRYLKMPARRPAYRGDRPHAEFVTNLPMPRDRLLDAVRAAWVPPGRPRTQDETPDDLARSLALTKFEDIRWIERL